MTTKIKGCTCSQCKDCLRAKVRRVDAVVIGAITGAFVFMASCIILLWEGTHL
jgi:hypothetical protein